MLLDMNIIGNCPKKPSVIKPVGYSLNGITTLQLQHKHFLNN